MHYYNVGLFEVPEIVKVGGRYSVVRHSLSLLVISGLSFSPLIEKYLKLYFIEEEKDEDEDEDKTNMKIR